ncbi:MAG: 3-deoxy-D-manno-octulosonic acid transferase [Thermoanaerobaculaceae bacterium]
MAGAALWLYRAVMAAALPVAAPWLLAADRRRGKRRPPLAQRLGGQLPSLPADSVWVQAVSVGEVAVARLLLAELRRRHPETAIILSATTATGLSLATGQQQADVVVPFPLDLPGPVRRVLDAARPRLVVLVETELWPEMLAGCAERGVPVAIVNARVSDRSFRGYRLLRPLLRPLLEPVTLALAQEQQDADRLVSIGLPAGRVQVLGNLKFDVGAPKAAPGVVAEMRRVAGARRVVVAGSTMEGEEVPVLRALRRLPGREGVFLLLAPRHPERAGSVLEAAARIGFSVERRTLLSAAPSGCEVVVLDTVGELAALYELANVAFVGGSLVSTGGHNPIEPARFAVPVLTGPHVKNFAAVFRRFFAVGAARVVRGESELAAALQQWLGDPEAARCAGEAGRRLLEANAGATSRTVTALERFLP